MSKERHPISCAITNALTSTAAEIVAILCGVVWIYNEPTAKGVVDAVLAVGAMLLAQAIYRKENK